MFTTKYVDNFSEFYESFKDHVQKHYEDFASTYGGSLSIDPDIELFQQLIDLGHSNIFTLWDNEEFIGYVSITVSPSPLFKGKVDAVIDHFYLIEDVRGKGFAKKVVEEIEKQLSQEGLTSYNIAFPAVASFDKFANKLGFKKQSSVYVKMLGDSDGS